MGWSSDGERRKGSRTEEMIAIPTIEERNCSPGRLRREIIPVYFAAMYVVSR